MHLVDRMAEQHQGIDVVRRSDAHAVRPRRVANGLDAVHLLAAEREPPPRVQPVRRAGRDERVVAMMALVDPPLRGDAVQVADRLGALGSRAGAADEYVGAPRLTRLRCGDQVADERPPSQRGGARRAVQAPLALDRIAGSRGLLVRRVEQRRPLAVGAVARSQQSGGVVEVLVGEWRGLDAGHAGWVSIQARPE